MVSSLKFRPQIAFIILGSIAIIFLMALNFLSPNLSPEPEQSQIVESPSQPLITAKTEVYERVLYSQCGHSILSRIGDNRYLNLSETDIAAQGKQLIWQNGQAYIEYQVAALCPSDISKVHLRIIDEKIALFKGPLGSEAEFIEYLPLSFYDISPRWLAQLTAGGLEFDSHEQLMMALDNLDEINR